MISRIYYKTLFFLAAGYFVVSLSARLEAAPLPLGKLSSSLVSRMKCPDEFSCHSFVVECPKVSESAKGSIAVGSHKGKGRGVVVFFTGIGGISWFSSSSEPARKLTEDLRNSGFSVIQVSWKEGWWQSSPGNDVGIAHLACRPATVIQHIHKEYYLPLGIRPSKIGVAGFCVTGNSGGAAQVTYPMSHYGMEDILDVVIPTGGPPFAALAKSCMNNPEERAYWLPATARQQIDRAFGFFERNGPAVRSDASFISRFKEESIATGGTDYYHPKTRIHFILGESDKKMQTIAKDYYDKLVLEKTPYVKWEIAPGATHTITDSQQGVDAIKNAILENTPPPQSQKR